MPFIHGTIVKQCTLDMRNARLGLSAEQPSTPPETPIESQDDSALPRPSPEHSEEDTKAIVPDDSHEKKQRPEVRHNARTNPSALHKFTRINDTVEASSTKTDKTDPTIIHHGPVYHDLSKHDPYSLPPFADAAKMWSYGP